MFVLNRIFAKSNFFDMVNFNGTLIDKEVPYIAHANRGLYVGDSVFESFRAINGSLIFWEDHYLRLMASMRILRMSIPMSFSMEYLEAEISKVLEASNLNNKAARVRLTIYRAGSGTYNPKTNDIEYIIEATALENSFFVLDTQAYEVELFKDFYVNKDMLSNLKTNNKVLHVIASVFANENGYKNCLLINAEKQVVEAINGNLFLIKGNTIKTPPKEDGALNGIIRKKLLELIGKLDQYTIEEASISPFEIQKADEIFITNAIVGIQPVTKYRKKTFESKVAKDLIGKLNAMARLGSLKV